MAVHDVKLNQREDGSFLARLYDARGRRRTLRLGRDHAAAQDEADKLGRLVEHQRAGRPLPADLSRWVHGLP
ncbi:hypothetical protein SB781_38480, partial [Paraburkholderia sp. SIMBA_061]